MVCQVTHELVSPARLSMRLRARTRAGSDEAGQGCVDWPTGRVILQVSSLGWVGYR